MSNYKQSLVAYWPLDEDSGSTAYDYSGNGNDGTANGAGPSGAGTVSGPLGTTAYSADGTDDYIDFGSDSSLDDLFINTATLSAWVKVSSSTETNALFGKTNNGGWQCQIRDAGNPERNIRFIQDFSNDTAYWDATGIEIDAWNHFAVVYDSSSTSNTPEIYINGRKRDVSLTFGSADGSTTSDSSSTLFMFAKDSSSANLLADGSEARFYNRALTPNEIQYLYEVSQRGQFTSKTKTL